MNKQKIDQQVFLLELKQGNNHAIRRVYEEAFPACSTLILQNSGSIEDAKDLFQEALIICIQKLKKPDFKLTATIKTFLFAIVRNLWLKQLRNKGKKGLVLVIDQPDTSFQLSEEDTLEDKVELETKYIEVEKAMKTLSKECKKIILAYYFHKIALKDIAKQLDYTANFIKVKKKRCMDVLKKRTMENYKKR